MIIGGGKVGFEKLKVLLANSPGTAITLLAANISNEIKTLAKENPNIDLIERDYQKADIETGDIIIAAVNDINTSEQISKDAREKGRLINVADKPALCDFYLGAIVQKGHLKIAISTNGKSPTMARRLKEMFSDMLPGTLNEVIENMNAVRNQLKGDFAYRINELNNITKTLTGRDK